MGKKIPEKIEISKKETTTTSSTSGKGSVHKIVTRNYFYLKRNGRAKGFLKGKWTVAERSNSLLLVIQSPTGSIFNYFQSEEVSDPWIYLFIQVAFLPYFISLLVVGREEKRKESFTLAAWKTYARNIHARYVLWPRLCIYWHRTAVQRRPWSTVIPIIKDDLRIEHLGGKSHQRARRRSRSIYRAG